jgi:hypothetical protein
MIGIRKDCEVVLTSGDGIISFPKYAYHSFIGSCAVMMMEPLSVLFSIISNRTFISSLFKGVTPEKKGRLEWHLLKQFIP